jgi:tetratricopeptide (TPR) repeat protein
MHHHQGKRDTDRKPRPYTGRLLRTIIHRDDFWLVEDALDPTKGRSTAEGCQTLLAKPHAPVELLFHLAMARLAQGLYEHAEAAVCEALQRQPGYTDAWVLRAKICLAMQRPNDAIDWALRAVQIEPRHPFAWRMIAESGMQSGNWIVAKPALWHLLEIAPLDDWARERITELKKDHS